MRSSNEKPDIEILERTVGGSVAQQPTASIVVPAYRSAAYVGETLASAMEQRDVVFEIIVVNDGSPDTDELETALEPFCDHITYIKIRNSGAGAARNIAIEQARGEWIAFLDADDIWHDGYLASQIGHASERSLDMVYCDAIIFSDAGERRDSFMDRSPSIGEVSTTSLLAGTCNVITSGTIARRQTIIDVGLFEWERTLAEDFHLWMRIAAAGRPIGYQTQKLLRYRVHPQSLSGDNIARVRRSIGAYERVRDTIDLDDADRDLIAAKLRDFEGDLAVELGKSALANRNNAEASEMFRRAAAIRGTMKLRLAAVLATATPWLLRAVASRQTDV